MFPVLLESSDLHLVSNTQKGLIPLSPNPTPLFLNIWMNNLIPKTHSSFEMFCCSTDLL